MGIRIHDNPLPDEAEDIGFQEFFQRLMKILSDKNTEVIAINSNGDEIIINKYTNIEEVPFMDRIVIMDTIHFNKEYVEYRDEIYNL